MRVASWQEEDSADHLGSRPSGSLMPGQQGALASARRGCLPCRPWGMVEGPVASGRASTAGLPPSPKLNKLQLGIPWWEREGSDFEKIKEKSSR